MNERVAPDELKRVLAQADCLHDAQAVQGGILKMAQAINKDLENESPVVLVVMNGGLVPAGWLLPQLQFLFELDYIHATRYRGRTIGDELHWLVEPHKPLAGRDVLLVDDILDEGVTLREIVAYCERAGANSVRTSVLVQKDLGRPAALEADYIGLTVDNRYVFGCGMDYKEYFRHLPAIYALGREE